MKKVVLIVVLLFNCLQASLQAQDVDSMLHQLKSAKEDTNKITLLQGLEKAYFNVDNDSAMYYNQAAEKLILKLKAIDRKHTCYHEFVRLYHAKYDYKNALAYCLKAVDAATEEKNPFQQATSYRALFNLYHNLRQNDSAVKYGLYSLQLTESIGDTQNIATNYGNLCWLYKDLAKYDKAIAYGEKGVAAGRQYNDAVGMLIAMNNLANCYLSLDQNAKAIGLFKELLEAGKQAKRRRSVRNALINLGSLYYAVGNEVELRKTVAAFNEYVKDDETMSNGDRAFGYLINGQNFIDQNRLAEAEKAFSEGIKIAEADSLVNAMLDLYTNMSKVQFALRNIGKSNFYDEKWSKLDQQQRDIDLEQYESDLDVKYQTEKKATAISLQQVQIGQQKQFNYFLIGLGILLAATLALSYSTFRQKQKLQQQRISELETEKQLEATEAVLKGEELERTRLAKDLHDGLGGMLSGIKYSLNTMKGNLIMTPDNAQAFERSIDMLDSSIQEMRRVAHNMMPESLVKFGLDAALKDFCRDMNQSGALHINYQSIGLGNAEVAQTTAIAIYRIVQELINNTMKHAAAKNAIVQVTKTNNQLSVTVEDDGKGFDTSIIQPATGMGWSNIRNRVEFLKGKLDVHSHPGKGTSVLIELNQY